MYKYFWKFCACFLKEKKSVQVILIFGLEASVCVKCMHMILKLEPKEKYYNEITQISILIQNAK